MMPIDTRLNNNSFQRVAGNRSLVVKSSPGVLVAIMINNNASGGTATFYDGIDANGTAIGKFQFGTPAGGIQSQSGIPSPALLGPLNIQFNTGLTVIMSGSDLLNDITVVFQ